VELAYTYTSKKQTWSLEDPHFPLFSEGPNLLGFLWNLPRMLRLVVLPQRLGRLEVSEAKNATQR